MIKLTEEENFLKSTSSSGGASVLKPLQLLCNGAVANLQQLARKQGRPVPSSIVNCHCQCHREKSM